MCNDITHVKTTPALYIDDLSTVKLVKNPAFHKRSKHIEVRHLFVREKFEDNTITVNHIASEDKLTDILTKPLSKVRFKKLGCLMGLMNIKN